MAVWLLAREVSELCLGKPALRPLLSVSATVADALSALKRSGKSYVSVWSCSEDQFYAYSKSTGSAGGGCCRCVGKVCMVSIVCFLCREENLLQPANALSFPVSVLFSEDSTGLVRHLDPKASLAEAIDLMLEGAQNLVIPIKTTKRKKFLNKSLSSIKPTLHNNRDYCWITQEDIIRYLLNSIGLFSPIPITPINTLNAIDTKNILAVHYDDPALSALTLFSQALNHQSSVAIVDSDKKLIGEISPFKLNFFDETVVAAVATLSAGDLMAYIDYGNPPEDLVQLVKDRLKERNYGAVLEWIDDEMMISSSSSSDEEFGSSTGKNRRIGGYSARVVRRSEAIVCYPENSLVAVMIQALAHRASYVWVVEEDGTLVGVVTFADMLKVFRKSLKSMEIDSIH